MRSLARTTARRSTWLVLVASALSVALVLAAEVRAQDRGGSRQPRQESAPDTAEPDAPETGDESASAESEVVERDGQRIKILRFSGLDVAGRLKSPQLLYFLNRMRAEFDRPRLPHRSFLPEMERSTHTKNF